MAEPAQPIDLFELLTTGRAGPLELGKSSRETVRELIDAEDMRADGHYRHGDTESAWCIYGANCEFFFSPDFRLRSISVEPSKAALALNSMMATWRGDFELNLGRHPTILAGNDPIAFHALPKALQVLNKPEFNWTIGGGDERDIYIELSEGSRYLTLKYEINTIPVEGDAKIVFEIDYFLAAAFLVDRDVQGGE